MNYIKIIKAEEDVFEEQCNLFLKEIHEKSHRVMGTRFAVQNEGKLLIGFFTINDQPRLSIVAPEV